MTPHVKERLGPYLDGELLTDERTEILAHLAGCDECSRFLSEMALVDVAARSIPLPVPGEYFEEFPARVRARLGARRFRPPAWSLAAAAAFVMAVLLPLLLHEGRKPALAPAASLDRPLDGQQKSQGASEPLQGDKVAQGRPEAGIPPAAPAAEAKASAPVAGKTVAPPRGPDQPRAMAPRAPLEGALRGVPPPKAVPAPGGTESAPAAAAKEAYAAPPPPAESPTEGEAGTDFATNEASPPQHAARARLKDGAPSLAVRATTATAGPAAAAAGEARFHSLEARTPVTAEDARSLREAWRSFAESMTAGAFADEARVRAIEAADLAYRLSGSAQDRAVAEEDAARYLARPDAAQVERVKGIVEGLRQ